jgi:hypothetical protein
MSKSGAVTSGEIAGRLPLLEVAGLIERHGADARLPDTSG